MYTCVYLAGVYMYMYIHVYTCFDIHHKPDVLLARAAKTTKIHDFILGQRMQCDSEYTVFRGFSKKHG